MKEPSRSSNDTPRPVDPQPGERDGRRAVERDPIAVANDGGGGPPFIPSWLRRKHVHNEQTKLTATALSDVSVAFFVTGILTPLVTYVQAPTTLSTPDSILIGLGWLLTAVIVHGIARLTLFELEP